MTNSLDAGSSFSDFAEVAPGLFVGAHPEPEDPFDLGATVVVCLASGTSVRSVPPDGVLVHWPIEDGPVPDSETLRGIASLIAACLRSGAVVYVHCQAGMNRSALATARILMEQGMTAEEAIATVRERRRGSLSEEYANWLRSEEPARPRPETPQGHGSRSDDGWIRSETGGRAVRCAGQRLPAGPTGAGGRGRGAGTA